MVEALYLAVPFQDPEDPDDQLLEQLNEHTRERYPNGPTPDMMGEGTRYDRYIKACQADREKVFRGLGGLTTIALYEASPQQPFSVDYLREATGSKNGSSAKVRTEWRDGLEIPQQYLDMFGIVPPADDEVAVREADPICFYDNGEYFFPTFQFGHEGDPIASHIEVVERILRLDGRYPSFKAMLTWMNHVPGTKMPLYEFIEPGNFDPNKLWDIYSPHSTKRA